MTPIVASLRDFVVGFLWLLMVGYSGDLNRRADWKFWLGWPVGSTRAF